MHRIGKKKTGISRPIITRYVPDRERISRKTFEVDIEVRVFTDFSQEIRKATAKVKKCKRRRKISLVAFDKKVPDKLYIDGHFIAM